MQFFEKKSFFFWSITTFISRFYWKINTAIIILHSTLIIRITFSFIYLRTNKGSPKRRNASREMFIIVVVTLISLLRLLLFTCLFRFNEDITWKRRKNAQTRISIFEKEKFLTTWNVIITARFARFLLHLRFSLSTLVNQQLPRHSRYTPLLVYGDNRPRSRIERTPWKEEAILLRGSDCLPAWSKKIRSPSQILFVSRPMIVNRNIGAPWIGSFDRRRSPWIGSIRLSPHEIHPSRENYRFNWTVRKILSIKSLLSERAAF